MTTHIRAEEKIDGRRDEVGKPSRTATEVTIDAGADQLSLRMLERDTCQGRTVEEFHRTQHRSRVVNRGVVALEYVFGVVLGAGGAYALVDPTNAASAAQPVTTLDHQQTVIAGATAASLGGLALILGIVDSTRGGSSTQVLPRERRAVGEAKDAPCGERIVAGRGVAIAAGTRTAMLPVTDATGHTSAGWDALSEALFEGAAPPDRAALHAGDASGPVLGEVDLRPARKAVIDRAWAAVEAANTARAAVAFRVRFPDARKDDVEHRIVATGDAEMDQAFGAALDANDVVGARRLLAEWEQMLPVSQLRKAREAVVASREIEARVVVLMTEIDAALATPTDPADLGQLAKAAALGAELTAAAPTDSRAAAAQAKVLAARRERQKQLFGLARNAEKAGQLDDAIRLSDVAVEAVADDAKVTKPRDELRKRIARRYAFDAHTKIQAHDFTAAAEAQSKAEAILRDDREVVATRRTLDAQRAASEAALADAAERERRKADREKQEAELRATRQAEARRAESERLARLEQQKRREEEVRAGREAERQKQEADRLAKEEDKQRKDDEARAAREAERQKRAADRAAKQVAERQKQEVGRLTKEEAERKKLEAERVALEDRLAAERQVFDAKQAAERKKLEARFPSKKPELGATQRQSTKRPGAASEAARVASARATAQMTGVWAALGTGSAGPVTLVLSAAANGSVTMTTLGASGRVLARDWLHWYVSDTGASITGRALHGAASVRGDSMSFAGLRWRRVHGRTTLAEAKRPAASSPPAASVHEEAR